MSELAYRIKDHAGATHRRAVWGGARSVQNRKAALTLAAAAAPAWDAPVPITAGEASAASAVLVTGIRAIPSTTHPNEAGHLRPAVKVPVALRVRGLGAVSGLVSVQITMSPVVPVVTSALQIGRLAPAPGSLSFSFVGAGAACVSPALTIKGGTFTAAFMYEVAAGSTEQDFAIDRYGYCGGRRDRRDFEMNVEVTFQEHGKQAPTVLASRSVIRL